jgi:hypothetical protein
MPSIWRYFFPKPTLRETLPRLPKAFASDTTPHGDPPPELEPELRLMVMAGAARTKHDAYRLRLAHPDKTYRDIIKVEKAKQRRARRKTRTQRFWERVRRVVVGLILLGVLWPVAAAEAQAPVGRVRVRGQWVNVRAAPSTDAKVLGRLNRGKVVNHYGLSDDGQWYKLQCPKSECWITAQANLVELVGGQTVAAAVAPSGVDVVLADYALDPAVPVPGEPYRILITLANNGKTDAGIFSIGTVLPSGQFVWANVAQIAAGGRGSLAILSPGDQTTGRKTVQLSIDLEGQLAESNTAKLNNIVPLTYFVDAPYIAQSRLRIEPHTNADLHGGSPDFAWDGRTLTVVGSGQVAALKVNMTDIHRDMLTGELVAGSAVSGLKAGDLVGFVLSEGYRGWLRVASVDGALEVDFYVYG